jgi:GT2 family glycosyltransferase
LDERYFLYFEETDFCFRAKKAGFATWYVPESRVMHISGQSTKVDERKALPKRLPEYWFESRRRFFVVSYGIRQAILIDCVAIIAHALGLVKRSLQMRLDGAIPHFLADLVRHSVLRSHNRRLEPAQTSLTCRISL